MKPLTHTHKPLNNIWVGQTHTTQRCSSITARDDQVTYFYWFEDNLFLSFTWIQTCKHKNQDTCSTEMWHHQVQWPAFVRLLCQITPTFTFFFFFTCFVRLLVPFLSLLLHILSLQYSSFLFLPTFHSLSILALVPALSPLLSDKLFVGRNLRHSLLSCSQVLSLSLFLCLSILQRATGKALPSPSLWVSPFPLHPDCPKNSLSLSHTKTQIQCADIHVQYATFRQNAVLNIHRHTKCIQKHMNL